MARKRRRHSRGKRRRTFLLTLGGAAATIGLGVGDIATGAFSAATTSRSSNFGVVSKGDGIVGIVGQGPVEKNSREPMISLENTKTESLEITVTLGTCSDGTLYDNNGGSGCSVTFTLGDGNTQFVDIEASVTGTIPYSIDVRSPNFSLDTGGSVDAESGNVKGAVWIQKPTADNEFSARANQDEWTAKVDVRDDDGDDDLDRIEFEITEGGSGGTVVATKTVDTPSDRYKNNRETITPDDSSYDLQRGQRYTLYVIAYDADGNFSTSTVETTA